MKILVISSFFDPDEVGGAERMVRRLVDALPSGFEPEIACLAPDGHAETRNVNGVLVHRLPLRNVYQLHPAQERPAFLKPLWHAIDSANIPMSRALERIVSRVQPDIVHTHNVTGFSPLIWASLGRRRIPIVHTLHDHYLLCARSTMFSGGKNCVSRHLSCRVYSAVRLRFSSNVSAVIGVSRYILDRHLAAGAFPNASIRRVIRNPMFTGPPPQARSVPEAEGPLRIGFLGRLDLPKGLDVLLSACDALTLADWTLDIGGVGTPKYEHDLRSRFARPNVRFLGMVDASDFLASIDVLVVPSLWNEPLPLVVIEAFASGIPVVASRLGGIPEIVEDERTGFLVPPGSSQALTAVLERLIAAPNIVRGMRRACLAAATPFVPGVIAGEYAEIYRAVNPLEARPSA